MTLAARPIWIVAVLAACTVAGVARADELGTARGAQVPTKLDQEINQAVGSASRAPSSDVDTRIKDLDATRATIDQSKKPAVSLSVSGWIDQQVQYNVKQ